jgi:hypothetical protein
MGEDGVTYSSEAEEGGDGVQPAGAVIAQALVAVGRVVLEGVVACQDGDHGGWCFAVNSCSVVFMEYVWDSGQGPEGYLDTEKTEAGWMRYK